MQLSHIQNTIQGMLLSRKFSLLFFSRCSAYCCNQLRRLGRAFFYLELLNTYPKTKVCAWISMCQCPGDHIDKRTSVEKEKESEKEKEKEMRKEKEKEKENLTL